MTRFKLILLILCALQVPIATASLASTRPEYLGVSLAYPTGYTLDPSRVTFVTLRTAVLITVDLKVDTFGCVVAVAPEDPNDSQLVRIEGEFLRGFDFVPGWSSGKMVEQTIPVRVRIGPSNQRPDVTFPVDTSRTISDPFLYRSALELNGVRAAEIDNYPSVFCTLHPNDTPSVYPYVTVKLSLDSAGKPTGIAEVASNQPGLTQLVVSASAWARYGPASVSGRPVPSTSFLTVSFFPGVRYPTKPWPISPPYAMNPFDRFMFRLVPDTGSLLSPPIPRQGVAEELTLPVTHLIYIDSVSAMVAVDTLGRLTVRRMLPSDKRTAEISRAMARSLRFYPAIGQDGKPRQFVGWAFMSVTGTRSIRIRYSWLD
jgi:hypothetical protein